LCTFKKYKPKLIVAYFNVLWPSAKLMGLGALSQFLILRFSQLIITAYYGLDEAGRYGATMQLLLALWHISKLVYQINIPEFVRLRVKNNYCQLNRLVKRSQTYYIIIFFLGVVAINLFANRALEQINASIRIYDGLIYILIATALFLEGNHSNACLVLTTGNKVPYIKSAYVAGVIIAITTLYIAVRNLPLIYIVACPLIVQLLYNNWYWPYFLNKELFYLMQKDKDAKDKIYK
jgi:O-antigen/teichoic acid export membrane protein